MFGLTSKLLARRRAWRSAVSLSAGMLIRDHGPGAYLAAKRSARQARVEENDKAVRFWQAVARDVIARAGTKTGQPEVL